MADPPAEVTAQVFEPIGARVQAGPPQSYPWLFTFTGEDVLEITSWNSAAGVRVTMQGRVHGSDGAIVPFQSSHVPATDRSPMTTVHTVPLGELLNLIVYCDAGAPLAGQTFVRVVVRRGAGAAFVRLGLLIQGPITASVARAWPGSPIVTSIDVEPWLRVLTGTTPAAGANLSETVPTGARWELVSWSFALSTSATVTDRKPYFQRVVAGANFGAYINFSTIPASSFGNFTFGPNLPSTSDPINQLYQAAFAAPMLFLAGFQLVTGARNLQAGDSFIGLAYMVREWLDV